MSKDYHKFVDANGLKCPQPLLMLKLAMDNLTEKQIIMLESTDPHTDLDLEVWCERFGHRILKTKESKNGVSHFWIQKSSSKLF